MNYLQENYPNFDCDEFGNIYKKGIKIKPFKSNKYYQVCIFDNKGKKRVVGVHTVIAMKYLDFYEGCIVHHKDENTHNNILSNLEVISRSLHTSFHAKLNPKFTKHNIGKPAWNRGMKMSEEFCKNVLNLQKEELKENNFLVFYPRGHKGVIY